MAGDRSAAATFTFHANRCVDGTLDPGCRAVRCTLCTYLVQYRWQNLISTTKRRLFFILVPLVGHSCVQSCVLRYILRLFVFYLPFVFSGQGLFACPVPCVPLVSPISYWFHVCNQQETKTFRDVLAFRRQKVNRPCLHMFTLLEWL